jgi:very-short-patch-repair endonuclease
LVRRGDLIALAHGVYATADFADRLLMVPNRACILRAGSALATAGPGSVASHHTAALLHGLDLLGRPPSAVAITRPPGVGSKSGKRGVHVYTARLPSSHVGGRFTIPVTTVSRTVVDLARNGDFRAGVVAADSALHQRLASKKDLLRVLADCERSRGKRMAEQVVAFADKLAESPLESIARVAMRDCGLPQPELQVVVQCKNASYRTDFLWRRFWTVAEVDGAVKYDDRSQAMRQLRRDADLREAGYEVVHFSWQEITSTPLHVAGVIRAAFERGKRLHGGP